MLTGPAGRPPPDVCCTDIFTSLEGNFLSWESAGIGGDGQLKVYSKEGKRLIYAGVGPGGNGHLSVSSKEGKDLIAAGADRCDCAQPICPCVTILSALSYEGHTQPETKSPDYDFTKLRKT